jgi:hypothetical protein
MAESFDPYHKWLGIPPKDQPPNHYRLLGIDLFEGDPDVIEAAADQRMAHVRTYQTGQNSALSQQILNELSAAKLCLLDPAKKSAYDVPLREALQPAPQRSNANTPPAVPSRSRPIPKARPLPAEEPAPLFVSDVGSSKPTVRRRPKLRLPRQLAIVGTFSIAVILAAAAYYITTEVPTTNLPTADKTKPAAKTVKSDTKELTRQQTGKASSPSIVAKSEAAPKPGSERAAQKADDSAANTQQLAARPNEELKLIPAPPSSSPTMTDRESAAKMSSDNGLLRVFEDEPDFVKALTSGDGTVELDSDEQYSGKASVKVTPSQRFCENLPGLNAKIRHKPTAPDEFRYLRFAWKKRGGGEIWLQLRNAPDWFRYRAGPKYYGGWPGIRVDEELPSDFVVATRDLAADFGEFTLTGLALTANDGECAWFDHIYLARRLEDFERIEVQPNSPTHKLAESGQGNKSRLDIPDNDAQRKARLELQKKLSAELAAAKSPDAKRKVAKELIRKATALETPDVRTYVMLQQSVDLADSAADLDLAWQAIDELSRLFDVDPVTLRQKSLTEVSKLAKSSEQWHELADDACRLIVAAFAADQPDLVKKVAAQAQSFAKRSKDTAFAKIVASRANDALKLAGDYDGVPVVRETLKNIPDDSTASFTVGYYELCAAGQREQALPKLAKGDHVVWQKLAKDDLAAESKRATPEEQLALADAWWSRAEAEVWPGRHFLRMRAAEWYRRALPASFGSDRDRTIERLKEALATDEGLPNWELFDLGRARKMGAFVRIEPGDALRTSVDYDGPTDVTFVARTDSLNIRLFVFGFPSVIWNWEVNPSELRVHRPDGTDVPVPVVPLEPNRWYVLRYRITPQATNITVDDVPVFAENYQYGRFTRSPVGVNGEGPAVIDVKKMVVKPL